MGSVEHEIEYLVRQLDENRETLKALIALIDTERQAAVFYEGQWTVKEHVKHLLMTQFLLKKRIQLFIENEHPEITPYNPEKDEIDSSGDIYDYIDRFCALREEQLELLRSAPEAVFDRAGSHPGYEKYSFLILVRHIAMHDQFHLYRIEDLGLAKPDYIERF
jgi:hypothetical protein